MAKHGTQESPKKRKRAVEETQAVPNSAVLEDGPPSPSKPRIEVIQPEPGTTGPVTVSFPAIRPPASTEFTVYTNTKDPRAPRVIAGETDRVEFFSEPSKHSDPSCEYWVGSYDSASCTLRVAHAPFHPLSTRVKALKDLPPIQSTSNTDSTANTVARATLGTAFGTKKAQRAIKTAERNQIDADSMAHVRDHLVSSITTNSAALPTKEEMQAVADAARPIPPFNLDATTPKDVYDISAIVTPAELNALPIDDLLKAPKAKEAISKLPFRGSQWVNSRIAQTWSAHPSGKLDRKELKRLRTLVYISYLLQFRAVGYIGGFSALQKKLTVSTKIKKDEEDEKPARVEGPLCPDVVVEGMLRRYTEAAQGSSKPLITSFTKLKLLGYLSVLCLSYDDFSCHIGSLPNDLQMERKKLQEVFKSLGCKVERPPSAEQQARVEQAKQAGKDANEALKDRVAKLVVPLTFPVPKRPKKAR